MTANDEFERLVGVLLRPNGFMPIGLRSNEPVYVRDDCKIHCNVDTLSTCYNTKDLSPKGMLRRAVEVMDIAQTKVTLPTTDPGMVSLWLHSGVVVLVAGWVEMKSTNGKIAVLPGAAMIDDNTIVYSGTMAKPPAWFKEVIFTIARLALVAGKQSARMFGHHLGAKDGNGVWTGWTQKVLTQVSQQLYTDGTLIDLTKESTRKMIHSILHLADTAAVYASMFHRENYSTPFRHLLARYQPPCLWKVEAGREVKARMVSLGSGCRQIAVITTVVSRMVKDGSFYTMPPEVQVRAGDIVLHYVQAMEDPFAYGEMAHVITTATWNDTMADACEAVGPYVSCYINKVAKNSTLARSGIAHRYEAGQVTPSFEAAIKHILAKRVAITVDDGNFADLHASLMETDVKCGGIDIASLLASAGFLSAAGAKKITDALEDNGLGHAAPETDGDDDVKTAEQIAEEAAAKEAAEKGAEEDETEPGGSTQ